MGPRGGGATAGSRCTTAGGASSTARRAHSITRRAAANTSCGSVICRGRASIAGGSVCVYTVWGRAAVAGRSAGSVESNQVSWRAGTAGYITVGTTVTILADRGGFGAGACCLVVFNLLLLVGVARTLGAEPSVHLENIIFRLSTTGKGQVWFSESAVLQVDYTGTCSTCAQWRYL